MGSTDPGARGPVASLCGANWGGAPAGDDDGDGDGEGDNVGGEGMMVVLKGFPAFLQNEADITSLIEYKYVSGCLKCMIDKDIHSASMVGLFPVALVLYIAYCY